jgi:uncharacterized protein DUF4268
MELGRLEEVDVRAIWEHEARDFTPWLLEHEDHLAETLGVDLELEQSEHPVGGFSLDLIGRDLTNDCVLMVENQLERTDHNHLGQILTYAAGTDASSIVWIATSFREEHRQAMDWLNEQTREDVRLFGIEIQAVRIGSSLAAPLFKLVAKPNSWQQQVRSVTRSGKIGTKALAYQAFWAKYLERLRNEHPDWSSARTPPSQNWFDFRSPVRGTRMNVSFAQRRRLRNEIYIDTGDEASTESMFEHLAQQSDVFEEAYGGPVQWEELPNARASRIAVYRDGGDVNLEDNHDDYLAWFFDSGVRLRRALAAVDTDFD